MQYVSRHSHESDSSMNTKCSSGQRISCRHSDACQVQVILITAIIYTAETKWQGGTEPGCQAATHSYWLEKAHLLALIVFLSSIQPTPSSQPSVSPPVSFSLCLPALLPFWVKGTCSKNINHASCLTLESCHLLLALLSALYHMKLA